MEIPTSASFIKPFVLRHAELRKNEPIVAYYCLMYAVQQLLDSHLHQSDEKVAYLAGELMNTLEEMKTEISEETLKIVQNDELSEQYVLNFANSVFERAEKSLKNVSKQTAVTFAAAAQFLQLQNVWNPVNEEEKSKIKYCKFQAATILKAIRDGVDLGGLNLGGAGEHKEHKEHNEEKEHSEESEETVNLPTAPQDPDLPSAPRDPQLPSAPSEIYEEDDDSPDIPPVPKPPTPEPAPPKPAPPAPKPAPAPAPPAPAPAPSASEIIALTQKTGQAQKHAKYAISALNYEDVKTAISELEKALDILKNV